MLYIQAIFGHVEKCLNVTHESRGRDWRIGEGEGVEQTQCPTKTAQGITKSNALMQSIRPT